MAGHHGAVAIVSGFIISLNQRRALMGINTDNGISIVEVLDEHEPALGDSVAGPLHGLGCRRLHNVTQAVWFDALVQEIRNDLIRMRNVLDDEFMDKSAKPAPAR